MSINAHACHTHACTHPTTHSVTHTDTCTLLLVREISVHWENSSMSEINDGQYCSARIQFPPLNHTACTGGHKPSLRVREKGTRPSLLVQSPGEITSWHLFPCCSFTYFLGPFFLLRLLFSLLFKSPFSNAPLPQWKEHKLNGTEKE